MTLDMIAPDRGDSFVYEYDFGDGWQHKQVWAWNSGPFDPNGFDLNTVNKQLMKIK